MIQVNDQLISVSKDTKCNICENKHRPSVVQIIIYSHFQVKDETSPNFVFEPVSASIQQPFLHVIVLLSHFTFPLTF